MCQHSPGIAWVGVYSVLVQKIPVWSSGNTSLKALWAGALPLFRLLPICFIFLFPRPLLTHEVDVCLGVLLPRILGTGRAAMAAAPCPAGYRDCSSGEPNHWGCSRKNKLKEGAIASKRCMQGLCSIPCTAGSSCLSFFPESSFCCWLSHVAQQPNVENHVSTIAVVLQCSLCLQAGACRMHYPVACS